MFLFDKEMPNGSNAKYHKAVRFEVHAEGTHATVNSYHKPEMEMISWQDTYIIPAYVPGTTPGTIQQLQITSLADIEMLLTAEGSPFAGGVIVPEEDETLDSAKARKRAMLKLQRSMVRNRGVITPYGPVASTEESRGLLRDAFMMIPIEGKDFVRNWRMLDKTTYDLDAEKFTEVFVAVNRHITECQSRKMEIDALIDNAQTIDEVNEINVTVGWPGDEPQLPAPTITKPIVGAVE